MFNLEFTYLDAEEIIYNVKNKGFFVCEQALNKQYIEELLQEINFDRILVNHNDVGAVIATDVRFLTHCLAS